MTELQMGLIGLGTAAVVAVFGYNKWQELRQRKAAETLLRPQHEDVLLGGKREAENGQAAAKTARAEPALGSTAVTPTGDRLEPVLQAAPAAVPHMPSQMPPAGVDADRLAVVDEQSDAETVAAAQPLAAEGPDDVLADVPYVLLDPRLEFIVAMDRAEPVSALQILHSQRDPLRRVGKAVYWLGFNEKTREWERLSLDRDMPLRHLRVGLQLVDRMGPLGEADLAVFVEAMGALADELMVVADMPAAARVLEQAAELDRFCAAVDLEIGLNLVSRGSAFSGTKIRGLAEAAGMVLGSDGMFTRYDEDGRALFSLQNYETLPFAADTLRSLGTHGLTFLLDVPRVEHGEKVFTLMTELAKRFAETLQGALVDDNRQPLTDSQLDHIRREFIGKPQQTMAAYGLPAGSPQARRLFS